VISDSPSSVLSGLSTQFAAIAVKDGHQLCQVAAPMNVSNLVPVSGLVLVGDAQGEKLALDQASGHQM
jgi:hypothetical protein